MRTESRGHRSRITEYSGCRRTSLAISTRVHARGDEDFVLAAASLAR